MERVLFHFLVVIIIKITIVENFNHPYEIVGIEKYGTVQQYERDEEDPTNFWKVSAVELTSACDTAMDIASRTVGTAFKYYPNQNFVPEVHQYEFVEEKQMRYSSAEKKYYDYLFKDKPTEQYSPSKFGVYCGSLPPVYLRISQQSENEKKLLKVVVVEPLHPFMMELETRKVKVVSLGEYGIEEFEGNPLLQMNLDVRRNLCAIASVRICRGFTFFDNFVPKGQVYELQYADRREMTIGISCPAVPHFLIHQKDKSSPRKITFIQSPVEEYRYGGIETIIVSRYSKNQSEEKLRTSLLSRDYQTRWHFCSVASKFIPNRKQGTESWARDLINVIDGNIGSAIGYHFIYQNGEEAEHVAVQCAEEPTMYVRLDEMKKEIVVLVFPTTSNTLLREPAAGEDR